MIVLRKIKMYSTLGCHLCDLALNIIRRSPNHSKLELKVVDIAEDDCLIEQYGTQIPVVYDSATQSEICWPFTDEMFENWLVSLP